MEFILRRGAAAPLPWSPWDIAGATATALWRRLVLRLYSFAERLPSSSQGEPSPEWFRYPLP
jgi:hypothetical protein